MRLPMKVIDVRQAIIARSRSATPPQQTTKGLGVSHRHPHGACAPLSLTPGLALAVLPRGQGRGAVSQYAYALASRAAFVIVARTHGPAWYARSGPALEKPGKNISVSPGGRRLRGDVTVRDGAALRLAVACCCRNVIPRSPTSQGGSRAWLVLLLPPRSPSSLEGPWVWLVLSPPPRSPSSLEGSWVQLVLSPPPRSPTAQEGSRAWLVFVPPPRSPSSLDSSLVWLVSSHLHCEPCLSVVSFSDDGVEEL